MAVKSSGTLSFNTDIVGEFGGSAPHSLSEYKRGGSLVPEYASNTDIPTTNSNIQFSHFYGAEDVITLTSAAQVNGQNNRKEITVSSFISSGEILQIPSDMWVWSDSTATPALLIDIPCTILNYGKIIGRGGNGATGYSGNGGAGGPAIKINSGVSGVTITNYSGAYIAGGGGGGAAYYGGGGGGAGGGYGGVGIGESGASAGGTLNAAGTAGSNNTAWSNLDQVYYTAGGGGGGGSGGGGGGARYAKESQGGGPNGGGGGGGGGRILPGTGGAGGADFGERSVAGGAGGSAGNAASNVYHGGGGGGWGAKGGNSNESSGGAGGKAIEDSGNTYTLTNNGTIYGATT